MTLDFYGESIFRLFQDNAGGILRDPQAEPEARILVPQPRQTVCQLTIDRSSQQASVATRRVLVTFDKATTLMTV